MARPLRPAPVRGHSAGGGLASGGGDGSAPVPRNCFPGPRAAPRADTLRGVQRGLEGGAAQPPGVRRRWECQPKPQRAPCWAPGPHPKPSRPVGGRESSMPSPQDTLQPLNPTKKHVSNETKQNFRNGTKQSGDKESTSCGVQNTGYKDV